MEENRFALFQVDVSHETGEIRLFIETGCGLRPVLGWPDAKALQRFAIDLFNISNQIDVNMTAEEQFKKWAEEQFEW